MKVIKPVITKERELESPEFHLHYADIIKHEGIYEPKGIAEARLIVLKSPFSGGLSVIFFDGDRGFEPADTVWQEYKFRQIDERVIFGIQKQK